MAGYSFDGQHGERSAAKRPVYRQMLEDAQAGKFDVLVTHTLDRLSRNLRVMLETFHLFSQNNVT